MQIGALKIGDGRPCAVIAELSGNHNGSLDRLLRLIDAAQNAGASAVKTQAFEVSELLALRGDGPAPEPWGSAGWTMESLYRKAQTPLGWFPKIARHCEDIGIPWFSSVFGMESLACLEAVGCFAYKVARLDNEHADLIQSALDTTKPVLVSGSHIDEQNAAAMKRHPAVEWLYCPPGYPTKVSDVRLGFFWDMDGILHRAKGFLGLSSHCLDPLLPVAAVARGCKLIEYHMMLADEPSELESNVSLTEHQFTAMIDSVRRVETMLA